MVIWLMLAGVMGAFDPLPSATICSGMDWKCQPYRLRTGAVGCGEEILPADITLEIFEYIMIF